MKTTGSRHCSVKGNNLSEVKEITITSEEQAIALLESALRGEISEDETVVIKFDGWPTFNLEVEGERYHSTVTTPLIKGLLEYQQALNRLFADTVYARGARALTEEDRANLELTFRVDEGCSDIEATLQETMNRLGEKMIEKMTGGQLVITVLGLALVASLYFGRQNELDHDATVAAENNRSALEQKLAGSNESIAKALQETNQALISIVKSTPDATRVTAGNAEFDRDQIYQLSQKERGPTTPTRIDGNYYVMSIKTAPDKWRLDVIKAGTDDIIKIDLFKGQHAADGIDEVMASFINETPIYFHALARVKDNRVVSANILGTKKTGLPPAEDFYALHGQADLGYNQDQED